MIYKPEVDYYPTNPAAAICDYYGLSWDEHWSHQWNVSYGDTVQHTLELPVKDKGYSYVNITLYRMPSGSYEAITYRC